MLVINVTGNAQWNDGQGNFDTEYHNSKWKSPLAIMLGIDTPAITKQPQPDGVSESISNVLQNTIIPGSHHHYLLKGLTNAF